VRGRLSGAGRLGAGAALTLGVTLGAPGPALAEQAAEVDPPTTQCSITDPRLPELSGLVVSGNRMLALNDGGDHVAVYVLDAACQVLDERTAPVDPYDPEDLAVAADGTLWVADTGDNDADRPTVALHALHPDGSNSLFRLAYPDGARDAEALLLAPDGVPYLVTKDPLGASGVYRPAAPLVDGGTVGLTRVASVNLTFTGTPGGPVGQAGQLLVTGGAVSADGAMLALRTYTDAYLWPLAGADVAGALAAPPARVALPDSPQGEAISFAPDNRTLVVASVGLPADVVVVPAAAAVAPAGGEKPSPTDLSAVLNSGRSPVTSAVIAAAVATIAVWIGGKFRRRGAPRG
jgi:hypothetical protein